MQLLTAPAAVSSVPCLSGASTFPQPRRGRCCSRPKLLPLTPRSQLHLARRSALFTPRAPGCSGHHHGHCCRGHRAVDAHGAGGGAAVMQAARAIGLAGVADALRERVQVCCVSLGLLVAAAACPHVAPFGSIRHLQAALVAVAYPLVGVMLTQVLMS